MKIRYKMLTSGKQSAKVSFNTKRAAKSKIEFRLTENKPGEGLTRATVPENGEAIYLHPKAFLTNRHMASATISKDLNGRPSVRIVLTELGGRILKEVTSQHLPDRETGEKTRLAILIDGKLNSAPQINTVVSRSCVITGNFTEAEVRRIVKSLNSNQKVPFLKQVTESENGGPARLMKIAILDDNHSRSYSSGAVIDLDTGKQLTLAKHVLLPAAEAAVYDLTWDDDGGGALVRNPRGKARLLPLPEAKNIAAVVAEGRRRFNSVKKSTVKGMFGNKSRFCAVLTDQGRLAIVKIVMHDKKQATITWGLADVYDQPDRSHASKHKIEFRLAENKPGEGLVKATVEKSELVVYLHQHAIITNKHIASARIVTDNNGIPSVGFTLTGEGAGRMKSATSENLPDRATGETKMLAIIVNGKVISSPRIQSIISTKGQITGNFSKAELQRIVESISPTATKEPVVRWTCLMHPHVQHPRPGKCPICAMDLIVGVPAGPIVAKDRGKDGQTPRSVIPSTEALIKAAGLKLDRRLVGGKNLPDLWEAVPPGSKSYELRKEVVLVHRDPPSRLTSPWGSVYFVPSKNVFYIQRDPLGSSTMTFYGPFPGDPRKLFVAPKKGKDAGKATS